MILYVAKNFTNTAYCAGSSKCINLIKSKNITNIVVQDVDKLRSEGVDLPKWLNGTPILVNKTTGEIFKGTEAVETISEIQESNNLCDEKIEGVLPESLTFCQSSEEPLGVFPEMTETNHSEGKITERELEMYMRKRNGS